MATIDNKPSEWAMDIARAAAHYFGTNMDRSVRIADCAHMLDQEVERERDAILKLVDDADSENDRGDAPYDNGAGSCGWSAACRYIEAQIKAHAARGAS